MEQTEALLLEPYYSTLLSKENSCCQCGLRSFAGFLFTGIVAPLAFLTALLFNVKESSSLYGIESNETISLASFLVISLFYIKRCSSVWLIM
jgi:hypothetical protein